jgi:hypothetical protein
MAEMCRRASSGVLAPLMPSSFTTSSMSASHTPRAPNAAGTVAPSSRIIFSSSTPETGAVALKRSCTAFAVRPAL